MCECVNESVVCVVRACVSLSLSVIVCVVCLCVVSVCVSV